MSLFIFGMRLARPALYAGPPLARSALGKSLALVLVLISGAISPAAAQTSVRPLPGVRGLPPGVQPLPAPRSFDGPVSRSGVDLQVRVPKVIGMDVYEAESTLRLAGYEVRIKFLDQPDRSFAPGQVSVQIPAAGTVQSPGKIELRVPLAAALVGLGALSDRDLERRIGFDLDTGRLEEVTHGADLVLRHHDSTRALQSNGTPYYYGEGNYVEPSDGAAFLKVDPIDVYDMLGSYQTLVVCLAKVSDSRRSARQAALELPNGTNIHAQAFCVQTSDGHIAAVTFADPDRAGEHGDFVFHFALFPQLPVALPHLPPRLLRSVTRP